MALSFMQTILFIFLLVIHTCCCISTSLHHDQECLALFEFKQSVSHQPYASVDSDSDCCLWDGVWCSDDGHVIELDLSLSSLHGPIKSNSSLFNLVHLQMLNLSMNEFVESKIPSEIARLKQLRVLDLSNSSFSGQIPTEISYLVHLTHLHLSWNPLKLQSPSLGQVLKNMTSLEELHLSGVDVISGLPPFLANLSSLRSIDLQGCQLQDEFPQKVFHLPGLKFLNMAKNPNLTGSLPEIQNITLLEHLDLSATSFSGSIPESISNLKYLGCLSLHACYFSGCIPRSLSNMTRLTLLALGQDELMGLDPSLPKKLSNPLNLKVCQKADWIGKLTNLEELFLLRININHEILPSVANLTKLSVVKIRGCFISGSIPSSFVNLTQLRDIDLIGNQLEGQISTSFSNFKSLETLILQRNNFNGRLGLDTFKGLTKLRYLLLDYNKLSFVSTGNQTDWALLPQLEALGLSSCNLTEFPSFLRFQKKLSVLLLSENNIKGLIPEWILNNTRQTLQIFFCSSNSITGLQHRSHFLPWVRLEVLDISDNKLQGSLPIPPLTIIFYVVAINNLMGKIPPLICQLKSLRVLTLNSNNMSGTLPPCLGNLSKSLAQLGLKRNNFHGPMMNAFTHGSAMEYIDLSENQFTGGIPKSLANCTNLKVLILGGNSFNDVFPFWLGALSNLQVLILRSNKLYGAIQDVITFSSHFVRLRIIDLSNNDFSGQLPNKFFQTLDAMKSCVDANSYDMTDYVCIGTSCLHYLYSMTLTNKGAKREYNNQILEIFIAIDLSCNNFEGQIPESLSLLLGLGSLNLSNNHFTGHILHSFGYLKNLESLDLSQNGLSGEIPQELTELGFLEIFNLSFNRLHGTIPQGKQFNTFDKDSYIGNPDLCGEPLHKKCRSSMTSTSYRESESLLPKDGIDFLVISLGVGSGFLVGIIIGNFLYAGPLRCLVH